MINIKEALHLAKDAKHLVQAVQKCWSGAVHGATAWYCWNKNELAGRLLQTFQSALTLVQSQRYAVEILSFASNDMVSLLRPYSIPARGVHILNIIIGVVDLVLELRGVARCFSFCKTHASLTGTVQEKLKTLSSLHLTLTPQESQQLWKRVHRPSCSWVFSKQHAYFTYISQKALEHKHLTLKRCVGSKFAQHLKERVPFLLAQLNSSWWTQNKGALKEGETLLQAVDRQVHKQLALHYFEIVVALLTIASGILLFFPLLPAAIGITVGTIALVLYCARLAFEKAFMESDGWTFSLKKAVKRPLIKPFTYLSSCLDIV